MHTRYVVCMRERRGIPNVYQVRSVDEGEEGGGRGIPNVYQVRSVDEGGGGESLMFTRNILQISQQLIAEI